jgi:hypothetical protein
VDAAVQHAAVMGPAMPDIVVPRLADLAGDGVPRHVVIALFNAMGDAFLALPVIRFVIERFGRDRVSVWANAYHGRTVYAELGDVFIASRESNLNDAAAHRDGEIDALRRHLPAGRALSWVSLNPYAPRTVVEDHAIACLDPLSLWEFRGPHLRVDAANGTVLHRSDQYFRVIGERRNPGVDRRALIGAVTRQRAVAIRDHVHRMSKRLIAVHAQTRTYKCWPQAHWAELGDRLRHEAELVILGGPAQALSGSSAYLTAPQGWDKQVAILAHADAFIGIDSCFSHVADAFDVPGVVLYGDAAAAAQWRPKGPALQALMTRDGDLASLTAAEVADRTRSCLGADRGGAAEAASAVLHPRQSNALTP